MNNQFNCKQCGACCREPGYVCLAPGEAEAIAEHLQMEQYEFTARYTRLTKSRRELSLTEQPGGACVFLTDRQACLVQAVKPAQCRDFPRKWTFDGWQEICAAAQITDVQMFRKQKDESGK